MKKKEPATLFGRRLRQARLRVGIPQDKLGVKLGLDEHTASVRMSRYETGVHEPAFDTAVKLARLLKVPAAYFYTEDDELADLVLAWGNLSKTDRTSIKTLVKAKLPVTSGDSEASH